MFEIQVVQYSTNLMRSFCVSSVFTMTWMTRIALVRIVSKTKNKNWELEQRADGDRRIVYNWLEPAYFERIIFVVW